MAGSHELTEVELDGIERRASQATPGPWVPWLESREGIGGESFIELGADGVDDLQMYVAYSPARPAGPDAATDADLDFIAHARQDVPRLVAEVRRLRDELRRR